MRRPAIAAFAAFVIIFVIGASLGQAAGRARLADTSQYTYQVTGCDGGTSVSLPPGDYVMTVQKEDVYVCVYDAGCLNGGQQFPYATTKELNFYNYVDGGAASTVVSCRGATQDAGLCFTKITPGT